MPTLEQMDNVIALLVLTVGCTLAAASVLWVAKSWARFAAFAAVCIIVGFIIPAYVG